MAGKSLGMIYVGIKAGFDEFRRDLGTAKRESESAGREMGRSLDGATTSVNKLGNAWKSLAAIVSVGLIVNQINSIGKAAIKAASDMEEVENKFRVVFRGMTDEANKYATELNKAYLMSQRESKQYLTSIQDMLVPMGMARESAGALSVEVVKLAADLGSFNNLRTADVMRDIQSAIVGEFEPMRKYGVVLSAATVQHKALEMGLAATKDELSALHKAQAAYQLIVESSSDSIGDVARSTESYANQSKLLQANIEDLHREIGEALLPVATEIVSKMNEWISANQEFIGQKVDEYVDDIYGSVKSIYDLYTQLPDEVIGAAGYGIVGRILLGGAGAAVGAVFGAYIEFMERAGKWIKENYRIGQEQRGVYPMPEDDTGWMKDREVMLAWIGGYHDVALAASEATEALGQAGARAGARIVEGAKKATTATKELRKEVELTRDDYMTMIGGHHDAALAVLQAQQELAAEDMAETSVDTQEEAVEQVNELWLNMLENTQKAFGDTFYDIFRNGVDSASEFFSRIGDMFARLLAEMASKAAMSRIVLPIVASLTGGSASAAYAGNVNGAIGNTLSLSSVWTGIKSIGSTLFSRSGLDIIQANVAGYVVDELGMAGLAEFIASVPSSIFGGFSAGIMSFIMTGDWKRGLGAGIGAALGSLIPIPVIGTILGGIIGDFVGSLFGDDSHYITGGYDAKANLLTGDLTLYADLSDNLSQPVIDAMREVYEPAVQQISEALNAMLQAGYLELENIPEEIVITSRWGLGVEDKNFQGYIEGVLKEDFENFMKEVNKIFGIAAENFFTKDIEGSRQFELLTEEYQQKIREALMPEDDSGVSYEEIASFVEGWTLLGQTISQFELLIYGTTETVSAMDAVMMAAGAQFDALYRDLERMGIDTEKLALSEAQRADAMERYAGNLDDILITEEYRQELLEKYGADLEGITDAELQRIMAIERTAEALKDATWNEINEGLERFAGNSTAVTSAMDEIIQSFDEWEASLIEINASQEDMTRLFQQQVEAILKAAGVEDWDIYGGVLDTNSELEQAIEALNMAFDDLEKSLQTHIDDLTNAQIEATNKLKEAQEAYDQALYDASTNSQELLEEMRRQADEQAIIARRAADADKQALDEAKRRLEEMETQRYVDEYYTWGQPQYNITQEMIDAQTEYITQLEEVYRLSLEAAIAAEKEADALRALSEIDTQEALEQALDDLKNAQDEVTQTTKALEDAIKELEEIERQRVDAIKELVLASAQEIISQHETTDMQRQMQEILDWYSESIKAWTDLADNMDSDEFQSGLNDISKAFRYLIDDMLESITGQTDEILNNNKSEMEQIVDWYDEMIEALSEFEDILSADDMQALTDEIEDAYRTLIEELVKTVDDEIQTAIDSTKQGIEREVQEIMSWYDEMLQKLADIMDAVPTDEFLRMAEDLNDAVQKMFEDLQDSILGPSQDIISTYGMTDVEQQLQQITDATQKSIADWLIYVEATGIGLDAALSGIAQILRAHQIQVQEIQDNYTTAWQEIIDTTGMDQHERAVYDLNKWYEEQRRVAEALGLPLDQINEAYRAQSDIIRQDLIRAMRDAEMSMMDFIYSIEQTISELQGMPTDPAKSYENFSRTMEMMDELTDPQEIMQAVTESKRWLDAYVQDGVEAIRASYDAQLEGLEAYKDAISESYQQQMDAIESQRTEVEDSYREQIEALEKQVDLAREWKSVLESVQKQISDMKTSLDNQRDIFERMDIARAEVDRLWATYMSASPDDRVGIAGDLQEAISRYLSLAQEGYQRPTGEYQSIYAEMLRILEQIESDALQQSANVEAIDEQILSLNEEMDQTLESLDSQIEALREAEKQALEGIDSQIEALNDQMQSEIEAFQQSMVDAYKMIEERYLVAYEEYMKSLESKLDELEYLDLMHKDNVVQGATLVAQLGEAMRHTNLLGLIADYTAAMAWTLGNMPALADGAYINRPTVALIGERGPEWVIPANIFNGGSAGPSGDVNITVQPTIHITADGEGINGRDLGEQVSRAVVYSLKYGEGRQVVKDIAKRS